MLVPWVAQLSGLGSTCRVFWAEGSSVSQGRCGDGVVRPVCAKCSRQGLVHPQRPQSAGHGTVLDSWRPGDPPSSSQVQKATH